MDKGYLKTVLFFRQRHVFYAPYNMVTFISAFRKTTAGIALRRIFSNSTRRPVEVK